VLRHDDDVLHDGNEVSNTRRAASLAVRAYPTVWM
jgi:hypothetical protein